MSALKVPGIDNKKENRMENSFKALIGKRMSKNVSFMGAQVSISKLSVAEVLEIQDMAKDIESSDSKGLDVLKKVIRSSVAGAADISDEEFRQLPMDELSNLSNEVMKFSGIGEQTGK